MSDIKNKPATALAVQSQQKSYRLDGRASGSTLRPLACELSTLQRADGSALWKAGATHILCAVHGPISPKIVQRENPYKATVSVVFPNAAREQEAWLTKILENALCTDEYPRSVVEIVIQIIQGDGAVLGCALHAAVAALMDAGLSMRHLPIATTCLVQMSGSITDSSSSSVLTVKLDPTEAEEELEDSSIAVVVNSNTHPDRIYGCETMGRMTLDQLLLCQQAATKASTAVVAFWRLAMEQKVTRQSQTLWSS